MSSVMDRPREINEPVPVRVGAGDDAGEVAVCESISAQVNIHNSPVLSIYFIL